jgi:hypothetical protein
MNEPVRNNDLTNTMEIVVDWTPLTSPADGNSPVISYSLEFDQGTSQSEWISLCGYLTDFTETRFVVSESIERGGTFWFRLRAKNDWGWGVYSSAVAVEAATWPRPITDIRSSVLTNGDYKAEWSPADDQGSEVLDYTLNVFDQVLQSWGPDLTLTSPYFVIAMPDLAQTYGYQ